MKNITSKMLLLTALMAGVAYADTSTNEPTITITPVGTVAIVKGNEANFREHHQMSDGWTGGIEEFTLERKLPKDWNLTLTGRAIFGDEDYGAHIAIEKPEVAFLRAGFTQYRRYYNDAGGFYQTFNPRSFDLDKDLGMDVGRVYVDFGFQIPKGPLLTAGYEHLYRNGTQSLLQWGAVSQGGVEKNIYPSYRDVDETTDVIKLGIAHHVSKVNFSDDFRYERYSSDNTTFNKGITNLTSGANQDITIRENYTYDLFNNIFRLDCQMNEKFYWSGGFLYNRLDGGGKQQVNTVPFTGNGAKNWSTSGLDYDSDSYVLNANVSYALFKKFTVYAGLQYENTRDTGNTDALLTQISGGLTNNPLAVINTRTEKDSVSGSIGARFTAIPFTTLYADAKWSGDDYNLYQNQVEGAATTVALDQTDSVFRQQYTVGFNSAPIRRVTLSGYYRYSNNNHDYTYGSNVPDGYPGFLTGQEFANNEIVTRVNYRPVNQLTLGLQYRYITSDIHNSNDSAAGGFVPAGSVLASEYNANVITVNATWTPLERLYLTASASLHYTETRAYDNGSDTVTPYTGNINTYMAGIGYALDEKTDLNLDYIFASAQNAAGAPAGLPLGWDYHSNAVNVGLTRRIKDHISARLRYGFYDYVQQSGGDQNNYWAHLISASCTARF